MEAAGDLDHLNILLKARSLKHGRWIEKILVQARKTLCGVGVNDLKDLTDKQLTALPNLTGRGNHATWENAILKLIASIKDGKQLVHLLKVLSYLEENIPLGPEFKELSCAVFKLSTATTEQIKMRAEFQRDWQRLHGDHRGCTVGEARGEAAHAGRERAGRYGHLPTMLGSRSVVVRPQSFWPEEEAAGGWD